MCQNEAALVEWVPTTSPRLPFNPRKATELGHACLMISVPLHPPLCQLLREIQRAFPVSFRWLDSLQHLSHPTPSMRAYKKM